MFVFVVADPGLTTNNYTYSRFVDLVQHVSKATYVAGKIAIALSRDSAKTPLKPLDPPTVRACFAMLHTSISKLQNYTTKLLPSLRR